ncbi:MAG: hypothetical protein ACP5G7_03290 [Anaerolineae bacterium]
MTDASPTTGAHPPEAVQRALDALAAEDREPLRHLLEAQPVEASWSLLTAVIADKPFSDLALEALQHIPAGAVPSLLQRSLTTPPAQREGLVKELLRAKEQPAIHALVASASGTGPDAAIARELLVRPHSVPPLLRAMEPETAEAIVPVLAAIASRILDAPQDAGAKPQEALVALTQSLSTMVAMACGALPLPYHTILTSFRLLGDTGVKIIERRIPQAPSDQVARLKRLLTDLAQAPAEPEDVGTPEVASEPASPADIDTVEATPEEEQEAEASEAPEEPATAEPQELGETEADQAASQEQAPPEPTEGSSLPPQALRAAVAHAADAQDETELGVASRQELVERAAAFGRRSEGGAEPVRAAEALVEALTRDPSPDIRRAATTALATLGEPAALAIHRRLDAELRAAQESAGAPGGPAEQRAGTRTDLVLAAARLDVDAALDPLLQALREDPAVAVRKAAAGAIRVRAARQPELVHQRLRTSLDAALSPELATLITDLQPEVTENLLADLASDDDRRQGRAVAALALLFPHHQVLLTRLGAVLTSEDLRARRAAAEVLQRQGTLPQDPAIAVAYHVALGQPEACRDLGPDALLGLRDACELYGPLMAGTIAILMLKLGLDPRDPLLDAVEQRLTEAAALPDNALTRTVTPPARTGAARASLELVIHRERDRQEAEGLLFRLRRLRARLRELQAEKSVEGAPGARGRKRRDARLS